MYWIVETGRASANVLELNVIALASSRAALDWTVDYVTQRTVFGRPLAAACAFHAANRRSM